MLASRPSTSMGSSVLAAALAAERSRSLASASCLRSFATSSADSPYVEEARMKLKELKVRKLRLKDAVLSLESEVT